MFEEEAKDYSIENYETCLYDDFPYTNDARAREQSFKDGAEFGYNKANEWHHMKDGDLPKNRRNVYVAYLNGHNEIVTTIASFRHKFWVFDGHKTECEIIAWCELPKYIEK